MPDPTIPTSPIQNTPVFSSDISTGPRPQTDPIVPSVANPAVYQAPPVDLRTMKASDILASIPDKSGLDAADEPIYTAENQTRRYGDNFNPFVDNEENFAKNQSAWSKFGNALVKTGAIAVSAFADGLLAIPDTIRGLSGGNVYKNSWEQSLDNWQTNLEDKFPNYYTKWEQDHPFLSAIPFSGGAANFWSDKVLKNTGFTIGAIGSAALTDVTIGAISEGIGEAPLISEQVGKAALWLNKAFTGTNDLEKVLAATSEIEQSTQSIASMKQLSAIAAGQKIGRGAEYLSTLWGASHAEAGMEARQGYEQVKKDLIQSYYEKNGYNPTGKDLEDIDKIATASGNVRYGVNMALLMASNAIQFEHILKPWNSFKQSLKSGVEAATEEQAGTIGLAADKISTAADIDKLKLTPETRFQKYVKPAIPNILAEGVYEEGGQYAAQVGTQNYYEDKYNKKTKGDLDAIIQATGQGLIGQFGTQEGYENMLLGGLTGVLFGPIEHKVESIQKARAGVFTPEQAAAHAVNSLNSRGVLGVMENNYDATASTLQAKTDIADAVKNNDIFKFKNLQKDQFFNFVDSGIKANRFEVRLEQLKLLKELPESEINTLFGIKDWDRTSNHQYIDALIQKAQSIKDAHDAISNIFQNPYQYFGNAKTEDQARSNEAYNIFEDYKSSLVKLSYNGKDFNNRLQEIQGGITKIHPAITNELIAKLTSPTGLNNLREVYKDKSEDLQKQIDEKLVSGDDRIKAQQQINTLNTLSEKIASITKSADFKSAEYTKLFPSLLDFELNNRTPEEQRTLDSISFPKEHTVDLIQKGYDINQINKGKKYASAAFDHLFTQEGYEDFVKNYNEWRNSLSIGEDNTDSTKNKETDNTTAPTVEVNGKPFELNREYITETPGEYKVQQDGDKYNLISPTGNVIETFTDKGEADKQKDYQNIQAEKLSKLKILEKTDSGKIRVEDATGNIQEVEPGVLDSYSPVLSEAEIVKQRTDFNKKLEDSLKELSSKSASSFPTGENNVHEEAPADKAFETQKKPLPILFKSTTYNRKDDKPYTQRQQKFFSALNSIGNKDNIRVILVTQKTEESLGLKGLIDDVAKGFDGDKSTIIATVFIDSTGGENHFVGVDGKRIGRVGEQTNIENAVYGVMPTADLSWRTSPNETRYSQGTPEEAVAYSKAWEERRNQILEHGDGDNVYSFYVTRGRGEYNGKDSEGNFYQTPVSKSIIDKKDIGKKGVVQVVTKGFITHQGENISFPNGRPVLQYGSTLQWLNNRKFSSHEVDNLYDNLHLLAVRSEQNKGEIDPQIENYLQGVLYFTQPQQGKPTSSNQVYLKDGFLYFGNRTEGVPFSAKGIEENQQKIKDYLKDTFQNINNKKLVDGLPFEEIIGVDGDKLKTISWKSYQHFLISDTHDLLEDDPSELKGTARNVNSIPLTTSIREVSKTNPLDTNFYYKSAVLTTNQEGATIFSPKEIEPKVQSKESTPSPSVPGIKVPGVPETQVINEVKTFPSKFGELKYTAENTPEGWLIAFPQSEALDGLVTNLKSLGKTDEEALDTLRSIVASKLPKIEQTVEQEAKVEKELPKETKVGASLPNSGRFTSDYRIVKEKYGVITADLDKEEKWFKDNISSSIPFQRVKNLIATTGSGYAYGQFKDAIVFVSQNAETGTTYHEAFHAVWSMFTDLKEKQSILSEFKQREGSFIDRETGTVTTYNSASGKQTVEQLAEEFRDYVLQNQKPAGNFIQRLFRDIVNFVQRLFSPSVNTIDSLFKRINSGYYKTSPIKSAYNGEVDYRTIPGLSVSNSYNFVRGNAVEILQQVFRENKNIVDLEEGNYDPKQIYQKVYAGLKQAFTSTGEIADSIPEMYRRGDINEFQYKAYSTLWDNISNNWGTAVELTNEYLNTFGVVVKLSNEGLTEIIENPEGVFEGISTQDKEGEESNYDGGKSADSYLQNYLTFDFKKNAPARVKMLYATLTETLFDKTSPSGVISKVDTDIYMQKALQMSKSMNYTLSQVFKYNSLEQKIDALKEVANTNPDYVRLINRLKFNTSLSDLSISDWKMAVSWLNTFSKQRPEAVIQYKDGDKTYSAPANLNTAARVLSQSWIDNLKVNAGPGKIVNVDKEGNYNFNGAAVPKTDSGLLSALGVEFDSFMLSNLSKKDKDSLSSTIGSIRTFLSRKGSVDISNLGEKGNFQKLAELYTKAKGEGWESTFTNVSGERVQQYLQNNTISNITNDINSAVDKDELLNSTPHLLSLYSQDSWYLKNLFDENGEKNDKTLDISYIDGIADVKTGDVKPLSKVDPLTRVVTELNQNLNKNYYILVPADSKTEWMLKMEHPIELSAFDTSIAWNRINNIFSSYYVTEKSIADSKTKAEGKKYDGLLADITDSYSQEELNTDKLKDYIETRVSNLTDYLKKNDVITEQTTKNATGETVTKYKLNGIEGYEGKLLTENELRKLFTFTEVNYMINNVEMHKLFFGDYGGIKDPLKRYKSFLSPRETSVYNTPEFNNKLNEELNKAGNIKLSPTDPGYWEHKDYIPTVSLSDILSEEKSITGDKHLPEELRSPYEASNGADAQSWTPLPAYREIMWKSGARWSTQQEQQFQYLMAQDRNLMAEDGHYIYSSPELKEHDTNLLKKGDPKVAVMQILKPIGSGFTMDGNTFLDKTSVAPLSYARVRGTNLESIYVKMHKEGVGYAIVESGRKIGIIEGNDNKDDIYSDAPFKESAKLNIPFRYYGIQVETGAEKDKGTLGSQLSKLAYVNLYNAGTPISEEMGDKVRRNIDALQNLQNNGYDKLLSKFGIVDDGESFSIPDKTKVAAILQDELFRREAPQNLKDILQLDEEGNFLIPFEAAINYNQIKSILFSYIDKLIAKPKVNGGQKIQLSGVGFEVKGKRVEAGKDSKGNLIYVSNGLKFYEATYDESGKRTSVSRMEVMLPNWFAKKLKSSNNKLSKLSDDELIEHLNSTDSGKKILNGVGFRIPTQELNSVEAFTVKAFTPSWTGDSIVVPEAITTKAGSDFDVDKLNTYLKNIYITNDGEIAEIPYFGTGEEAKSKFKDLLNGLNSKEELIDNLLPGEAVKAFDALADFDFLQEEEKLNKQVEDMYSKSLENEYFNSLEDLILLPENYERLIAANNSKELMSLRDNLVKLAPEEFGSSDDRSPLNRLYMSNTRHTFIMGKGGVGIAAVAQTNNSLNQLGEIYLDIDKASSLPKYQQEYIGDGKIALPHNSISIDGRDVATLSNNKDVDGRYISDKISQYINGFVDVAKDPFIAQIIQSPSLTGTFLMLEKAGTPTSTVVYFMNQPIIREYMKLLAKKNTTWLYDNRNVEAIRQLFPKGSRKITSALNVSNIVLKSNIETFYSGGVLNQEENTQQQQILSEFLKYGVMSQNLFDITQGTNYDTDSSGDPVMQYRKQYKTDKAREANIWNTVDTLLDKSHLGNLQSLVASSSKAISESLIAIENPEIKSYLAPVLDNLLETRGLSKDDYRKAARTAEEHFMTYAIQTSSRLNNRVKELMVDQSTAVATELAALKNSLPKGSDLYNNTVLQQLIPLLKNKNSAAKGVTIASKVSDAITSDVYTGAFRELRDNPQTRDLYYNLVRLSFLQSGISTSPVSFFKYLPSEDYAKVIKPVVDKMDSMSNLSAFNDLGVFFRNSWSNTDIVPNVTEDFNDRGESKKRLYPEWMKGLREKYNVNDIRNNTYKLYTASGSSSSRFITMNLFADQREADNGVSGGKILLQRLEDESGTPMKEGSADFPYYIYTPVNAWGDGSRAQEFYDTPSQSVLDNGYLKIQEIPQQEILDAYRSAKGITIVNRDRVESNSGGYIKPSQDFKAWDIGDLEGRPESTDRKTVNNLVKNSSEKPQGNSGNRGESFNEFKDRVINAFRGLLQTAPDNTLVVTHSSVIKILDSWIKEGKTNDNKIDINYYLAGTTDTGDVFKYKSDNGILLVARHGETEDNVKGLLRTSETQLTKKGVEQAQKVGEELKGTNIPQIITSDLPRAIHTSEIIASKVRAPFETFKPNITSANAEKTLNLVKGNC